MEECVSIALTNATSVRKAQNEVELTGKQLLQNYGQFLPNLVGTANYSYLQGNEFLTTSAPTYVTTKNYGPSIQIGTTLNLFNGLNDFASLKAALNNKDASTMTLARAKQQIVVDVTQSFLQVVLDSHLLDIAQKNLVASTERQKLLREQTRLGVRALPDLYRQEAQTSADQTYLLTTQNKRRDDEILLLRKLRLDVDGHYTFDEPNLEPPEKKDECPDEPKMIQKALDQRQDLKASQATKASADWGITAARSGFFPRLDLGFNVFQTGRAYSENFVQGIAAPALNENGVWSQLGQNTYFVVGLTLTWNLFDRFQTVQNVAAARIKYDNSDLDYTDLRLQIEGEIRKVLGDYRSSVQQLETSQKGLQSAQEAFDAVKGRYEVGASSFLDLITAQTTLVQAQSVRVQSQTDFILQKKLVEFYSGDLVVGVSQN